METDAENSDVVANVGNLIPSNLGAYGGKLGVTYVTNLTFPSRSIISKEEEINQGEEVLTGDEETAEAHVRFLRP